MPIGKLEPFEINSKQWPAYIRRVKQYIVLNEIKEGLRVSLLITVVGEATYSLMCDLCSPAHPETKSFDELVRLVNDHLEPQRSEIAERHIFRMRRQNVGESLTDYLQTLKHLATTCNFGATLEENLRDQFVSGLANELMRSRIFAKKTITYKGAVELALALEAAERHAEVSGAMTAAAVTSAAPAAAAAAAGEGLHQANVRRRGGAGAGGRTAAARSGPGGGAPAASPRHGGAEAGAQCWRCGKPHRADKCRFAQYNCDECGIRGHLKVMCKKVRAGSRQNYVSDDEDEDFFNIQVDGTGDRPYVISVFVDRRSLDFEVDTGSRISTISEDFYRRNFSNKVLKADNLNLRSYVGSKMESLGFISVDLGLDNVAAPDCHLHVIRNGGRPLMGREWVRALKINKITIALNEINDQVSDPFVNRLTAEFPEVFTDKLGLCRKTIQLHVTDNQPVYVRARVVPLALRPRVERELERLEREGTIYRVETSEYGTPIVPVIKEGGDIRICGDYKITINPKLKRDPYPLPRIEELFATLSGGEEYSKIDLKHSYQQIMLTEDSQPYTAITTTLRGIPNTVVFLDDICVTGPTRQEHWNNLRAVLRRLSEMGFTVKREKCSFLQKSVKYIGFIIDKTGLRPDPKKLEAICEAPQPTNVSQLKSFLGMLNYYGKFIPNLSIILHPLHALLKKGVDWEWNGECNESFANAKRALCSKRVLAHYEEGRPLVLAVDSSAYGLGAVLAHQYPDGSERPLSCVSRTLNSAEKNYSQLDKEALAIFFGITKHHQYLYGRHFILRTDHQPLSYIFGEKGGIPQTAASRLQRWAARLAAYDFTTKFVRSIDNGPADALSRLPLPCERPVIEPIRYVDLVRDTMPVSFKEIGAETNHDKILTKIKGYVQFGWPSAASCDEEKPYFARKDEIVLDLGCLIFKYRLIIPPPLQARVLAEIHEGHLGVNKMKNLSRSYVYGPSLDTDIEKVCRTCEACRAVRDAPPHATLHPWEFPLKPWQRIHADFAECAGKKYIIVIDAFSKWIEVIPMSKTDAESTISVFRAIFSRFGLPSQLVTDNGPPFLSFDFKEYCSKNCIKHVTSAPYRPQGNGAAENAVKTIKKVIKRAIQEGENVHKALCKFLFQYRNVEHATTSVSPAVALLGHRLRGRLDALRPDVAAVVRDAQARQVANKGGRERDDIALGEPVPVRDYSNKGQKWAEGNVTEKNGPISYKVQLQDGTQWRRHQDQVISAKPNRKSRYSLSRPDSNVSSDPPLRPADNDADDDMFEDAAEEGVVDESLKGQPSAASSLAQVPQTAAARSSTPPVLGASARALRAYNRANRA